MTEPSPSPAPQPLAGPLRYLLMGFAGLCVALGVVGIFVPGLPTTVFILMASWAAARSSPGFSRWLEEQRVFGPMIRNWRASRSVSRRAKWSASGMMALCAGILWWATSRVWLAAGVSAVMAGVLVWLWYRPEPIVAVSQATGSSGPDAPR